MTPPHKEPQVRVSATWINYAILLLTLLAASTSFVAWASKASGMDTVEERMEADRRLMEEIREIRKDMKEQTEIQRGISEKIGSLTESNNALLTALYRHIDKK